MRRPIDEDGPCNLFLKNFLLYFNVCTCFFQLSNQCISISFAYTFFNGLRSAINQVFSFFQSKASQVFYNFNYVQFVSACSFQHYIECCFFFNNGCTTGSRTCSYSYSSSSGLNAVFFFQDLCELVNFFN